MPRPQILIAACLAAALAGGICGSLAWIGHAMFERLSGTETFAGVAFAFAAGTVITGAFCLAGSVLFGLPLHALLTRLRWTGALAYMAGGIVPGLLLMADMARPGSGTTTYGLQLFGSYYVISGIAAALGFWLVARPDRRTTRQANPA